MSTTTTTTVKRQRKRNRRRRGPTTQVRKTKIVRPVRVARERNPRPRTTRYAQQQISRYLTVRNPQSVVVDYKTSTPFHNLFIHYAAALLVPEAVTRELGPVRIPDLMMLPCTVQQVKTSFTVSGDSDGGFILWIYPFMKDGFNIYNGDSGSGPEVSAAVQYQGTIITADDDTPFSIWKEPEYQLFASGYRIISAVTKLRYIGRELDKSGRLVSACLPPFAADVDTFDQLANYVFSYHTSASNGIRQVWLPSDFKSFTLETPESEPGFDYIPNIAIAAAGLPKAAPAESDVGDPVYQWVLEAEVIINYEIYGTNPILASTNLPTRANSVAMDRAATAASSSMARNGGGSSMKRSEVVNAIIGPLGDAVADEVADNPSTVQTIVKAAEKILPAVLATSL